MRISGLNSGIDTEQMIKDLMTAQRIPVDRVYQQKVKVEWKRDAYREINTKLLRLRNFTFDMTLQGTFDRNVATSSHTDILTVNATGKAQAGTYDLKVEKLAKAAQVVATGVTLPSTGSFTIGLAVGGEVSEEIEIDFAEGKSLQDIAAEINKSKDLGILAFASGDSISFTSKATGEDVEIVLGGDYAIFGDDVQARTAGQNAEVRVNGVTLSNSSNSFDLNGITVNLLSASPGTDVRVEVRHDVDAVVDKIKEFVNLYNEIVDELNLSTREEVFRDFLPLTPEQREALSDKEIEQWEEKAKSGLLRSDPMLSRVLSEMRMALAGAVGIEGDHKSLAQIGITTGSWYEYGRLNINEEKLRVAVEANPTGVRDIFTFDSAEEGKQGIARRLDSVLKGAMERIEKTAGKASTPYDTSALGEQIRDFESRLSVMEERLLRFEEAQWRKFTALEKVLGQLYAQSDWLVQQITAMQG
ncbi:MAG: flagellar filament capping protein FliD [Firmicutes bacterium]|nr:flagellar filament capping protein FliD [Bacillota bacterium]